MALSCLASHLSAEQKPTNCSVCFYLIPSVSGTLSSVCLFIFQSKAWVYRMQILPAGSCKKKALRECLRLRYLNEGRRLQEEACRRTLPPPPPSITSRGLNFPLAIFSFPLHVPSPRGREPAEGRHSRAMVVRVYIYISRLWSR